jgi:small subunit ribosomal protein S21
MPSVDLRDDRQEARDIDIALRKLKKTVERLGTLKKLQEKTAYEKPTTKRKRKAAAAVARHRRDQAKSKLPEKQY